MYETYKMQYKQDVLKVYIYVTIRGLTKPNNYTYDSTVQKNRRNGRRLGNF